MKSTPSSKSQPAGNGQTGCVLIIPWGYFIAAAVIVIGIFAGALALIASVAHGQAIVDPVCYISAPPVLPQSNPINCLQPRAFMPVVMSAP